MRRFPMTLGEGAEAPLFTAQVNASVVRTRRMKVSLAHPAPGGRDEARCQLLSQVLRQAVGVVAPNEPPTRRPCDRMMTRRAMLAAAASLAMTGWAGAEPRPHRLAYLVGNSPSDNGPYRSAFFGRLAELGYREGGNLVVERRFAEGHFDRLPALAAELVALKPDVLFAPGSQAALAASKATRTIPIVFAAVADPVGMGVVKALRQPGTNATGLSNQADEFGVKLLQLLRDAFPAASRVAVLHDPSNVPNARMLPSLKQAGVTLALNLRVVETRSPQDLVAAFRVLKSERPDVLYVLAAAFFFSQRRRIVEMANGQRQLAVYGVTEFADAGGLMSYSFSLIEQFRSAATFVDKILKGTNPAELPVEQPTRFELVVNLRTAKAQGVTFPSAVLLRADRVIE
jgi:putative tryptophan/tyrosine transport system substrate-binding protein